jgi:putative ABC transport system permease protein
MPLTQIFKIVMLSFRTAPLRLFLTILGIVIGVAAVIMVMGIGASAQSLVLSQVEKVGSNLVAVLPGASEEGGPPAQAFGVTTTTFTYEDLIALRQRSRVPHLEALSGYVTGVATLVSPVESFDVSFQGVSSEMARVESLTLAEGRFFAPEEEQNGARTIVLGSTRAAEFFPNSEALGQAVKLKGISFQVIGVLQERGSTAFANPDVLVYVPLATAQKTLLGIRYLNFARGKVDQSQNITETIADMDQVLRQRHDLGPSDQADYSIRNTAAALGALTNITDILKYFLLVIASVSLLVGGIGIMNSLLIAVNQRVREIGLRKAVGARSGDVFRQFLSESLIMTGIGGIGGVLFGIGITYGVSIAAHAFGYADWRFILPLGAIATGFVVALVVGVVFGVYPSLRAAKISPLEALRYE